MHYDFDAFLSSVKYLNRADILETAYKKHKSLDKSSTRYTAKARYDLQHSIQGLLYWIETKQQPADMSDLEFSKLKPLCENLIKQNELEAEAIRLFE